MTCSKTRDGLLSPLIAGGWLDAATNVALKSPGRPKDLEKREAILDAAARLFALRGVEGVPIEAIAAEAGVSKVTVYANFKDKAALLAAIVVRETCRLGREFDAISGSEGSLADRLIRLGDRLVGTLNEPSHVAMDRCLSIAAVEHPELGQQFFEAGPGHLRHVIAEMLTDADRRGEIEAPDPMAAAEDLLGLWFGFRSIESRFMGKKIEDPDTLLKHIRRTVGLFLQIHSPKT